MKRTVLVVAMISIVTTSLVAAPDAVTEPSEAAAAGHAAAPSDTSPDGIPPSIHAARTAVEADPTSAPARLALGKAIGEVLRADPMQGVRFAAEMLDSLKQAIELDPMLVEAYHWLAGYYLNAPPIAGGSVDLAEQTVSKLAEIDPASAQGWLEQIEARRGASGPN